MTNKNSIKSQAIIPRLDGIDKDLEKLREIGKIPLVDFVKDEDRFALTKYYLREALEGVFHIGSHILSRMPGGRATEYKEIAQKLGELKILPKNFAEEALVKMAGYRNRLTHFYAKITPEEIYRIINDDLADLEIFMEHIRKLLKNPQRLNLTVE